MTIRHMADKAIGHALPAPRAAGHAGAIFLCLFLCLFLCIALAMRDRLYS